MARGLTPGERGGQAYVKFGSPRRVREREWESNTMMLVGRRCGRDVKYAVADAGADAGFHHCRSAGDGAGDWRECGAVYGRAFGAAEAAAVQDPGRLIQLYEVSPNGKRQFSYVAGGMYAAWKQQAPSVEQMAIYGTDSISLSGDRGPMAERIRYAEGEWNLFSMLGVEPELGRVFVEADDRRQAAGTAVLTHSLWMRRYAGERGILGKTILLDARPYTVVGVLPAWFNYPDQTIQLWAPIYHEKSSEEMRRVDNHNYFVLARLKPGATLAEALSEADTAEKRVHMETPKPGVDNAANARTMLDGMVDDAKTQLYVLLSATSCVLLIGCLNVANLLVARSAARRKEISIRAALGGSRWRLLREQVSESMALAAAGGLLGLPMAWAGVRWLVLARPDMARVSAIHMDAVSVLFALGIMVVCGALAGLIPAASLMRSPLLEPLQESSRTSSTGQGRARMRRVLLAAEVGLTVVLLIAAGLLLKSYEHLRSSDIGCVTQNMLTMHFCAAECALQQRCEGCGVL